MEDHCYPEEYKVRHNERLLRQMMLSTHLDVYILDAEFRPGDPSDPLDYDECVINEMSVNGYRAHEGLRYEMAQLHSVIEAVKEKYHKESYEIMTDEDYRGTI